MTTPAIKIFKIGDCDWVAASTKEDAIKELAGLLDESIDEVAERDCVELDDADMDRLKFSELADDEETPIEMRTFREELQKRIDEGEGFPQFFATSEW